MRPASRQGLRGGFPLRGAFTLLEMLAVIFLTTLLLSVAVDFYLDLSAASNVAADRTRGARRASGLLDRVARDLEGATLLVKPEGEEEDRLGWPWLFLAESGRSELGADKLKFVTRSHRPRGSADHESDLLVVAYLLRDGPDGTYDLVRWSAPRLPEGLDRSFPRDDDPAAFVLATDVADFGVQLLDEEGGLKDRWDSSLIVDLDRLPTAAQIQVSFVAPEGAEDEIVGPFERSVLIPVRPLDLAALLEGSETGTGEDEEEDKDCVTVAECVAQYRDQILAAGVGVGADILDNLVQTAGDQCAADTGLAQIEQCR